MRLLLEQRAKALVNKPAADGSIPLDHAVSCNCPAVSLLLLRHDSMLYSNAVEVDVVVNEDVELLPSDSVFAPANKRFEGNLTFPTAPYQICRPSDPIRQSGPWYESLEIGNHEIISYMIQALENRRRRLQELAVLSLPSATLKKLDLRKDRILDERASVVEDTLSSFCALVPESLRVPSAKTSVYHSPYLTADVAEKLFVTGFRDFDSRDVDGYTPLAKLRLSDAKSFHSGLSYVNWLLMKGADLTSEVPRTSLQPSGLEASPAHHLSYEIGRMMFEIHDNPAGRDLKAVKSCTLKAFSSLPATNLDLLIRILTMDKTDYCICACSKLGCVPFLMFFKGVSSWSSRQGKQANPDDLSWHRPFIEWIDSQQGKGFGTSSSLCYELIRLQTFNILGLRHTCCQGLKHQDLLPPDDAEVEEIHSEDISLTEELDSLMNEFEREFSHTGGSMTSFLNNYWRDRMTTVLQRHMNLPLTADERSQLNEIGVQVNSY